MNPRQITGRDWALLSVFSLVPCLLMEFVVFGCFRATLEAWLSLSDAPSYIALARQLTHGIPSTAWDQRLFPGWVILISPAALLGKAAPGILIFGILFAGAVSFLVAWLTRDLRLAVMTAVIPPVWILQSSLGMSEPAYLCFILASFALVMQDKIPLAALLMGFAAMIRPTALFPWCGVLLYLWNTKSRRSVIAQWAGISGAVTSLVFVFNMALYGAPFRQVTEYSTIPNIGDDAVAAGLAKGVHYINIPFKALLETPWRIAVPGWKVIYIYAHVAFVLLACVRAFRQRKPAGLEYIFAVWAVLNTAYIVSTGPYWGFHSFDRYCLWAMPAYLFLVRDLLPKSRLAWVLVALASTLVAIAGKWNFLAGMA